MKHRLTHRAVSAIAAVLATGIVFGSGPAYADPASGSATTVEMPMPDSGGTAYQPPSAVVAEQGGSGAVDRDGTTGVIDPDGTMGRMAGPMMRAVPELRADPAPLSPRVRS